MLPQPRRTVHGNLALAEEPTCTGPSAQHGSSAQIGGAFGLQRLRRSEELPDEIHEVGDPESSPEEDIRAMWAAGDAKALREVAVVDGDGNGRAVPWGLGGFLFTAQVPVPTDASRLDGSFDRSRCHRCKQHPRGAPCHEGASLDGRASWHSDRHVWRDAPRAEPRRRSDVDPNTGLVYFGARYYDPEVGRFITQDTYLGEAGTPPSLHRYLYAYSNPTRFIDPDGREVCDNFGQCWNNQDFEGSKQMSLAEDVEDWTDYLGRLSVAITEQRDIQIRRQRGEERLATMNAEWELPNVAAVRDRRNFLRWSCMGELSATCEAQKRYLTLGWGGCAYGMCDFDKQREWIRVATADDPWWYVPFAFIGNVGLFFDGGAGVPRDVRFEVFDKTMSQGVSIGAAISLVGGLRNIARQWRSAGESVEFMAAERARVLNQRTFARGHPSLKQPTVYEAPPPGAAQPVWTDFLERARELMAFFKAQRQVPEGATMMGAQRSGRIWARTTTPWQRQVYQRSDIDWDLVRPAGTRQAGLTNWQAARKGYAPLRLNPETGRWEDVTLHHANQDPRGSVVEIWRSTHGRVRHYMDPPGNWRAGRPDWARAWENEQSAYWRWRTGAYDPPPTDRLRLPGD